MVHGPLVKYKAKEEWLWNVLCCRIPIFISSISPFNKKNSTKGLFINIYFYHFIDDSESCVRFNYRNFVKRFKCCTKQKLLLCCLQQKKFIEENPIPIPKERRLIKVGLRHRKPGCSCLLDFIQHRDLIFLEELIARFEEKSRIGKILEK